MDLSARVEKLERENRRLKRLAGCGLAIVCAALALGQASPPEPKTVEAARFVVVDENGRERMVLGMDESGPALLIRSSQGREAVRLDVPSVTDKPALYLDDAPAAARLEMGLTMNDPVIHLTDSTGVRARLATNELNAPLFAVYDDEGRPLFEVSKRNPR